MPNTGAPRSPQRNQAKRRALRSAAAPVIRSASDRGLVTEACARGVARCAGVGAHDAGGRVGLDVEIGKSVDSPADRESMRRPDPVARRDGRRSLNRRRSSSASRRRRGRAPTSGTKSRRRRRRRRRPSTAVPMSPAPQRVAEVRARRESIGRLRRQRAREGLRPARRDRLRAWRARSTPRDRQAAIGRPNIHSWAMAAERILIRRRPSLAVGLGDRGSGAANGPRRSIVARHARADQKVASAVTKTLLG